MTDGDPTVGDQPRDRPGDDAPGPWEQRIERARPWLAWALAVVPLGWVLLRYSGAGAGTRIEVLLVFTPFAAVGSLLCVAGALLLRHRAAAAMATVACAGFVVVLGPLFMAGDNAEADPHGTPLRVMTFNAKYGEADPSEVAALVEEHGVDVLGVQELTPALADALEREGMHDHLEHHSLHPAPDASGMGLYSNVAFEEVDIGVTDDIDPITGRFSLDGDQAVEITVVHPLPPLGSWRSTWIDAFGQLAEVEVGGPTDPLRLIIGDFNATLDQPTFQTLIDAGYHDAASAVGQGWVPTWGPGAVPLIAIDHVLVDRSVHVQAVEIHTVSGSDHRAVIAALEVPSSPG